MAPSTAVREGRYDDLLLVNEDCPEGINSRWNTNPVNARESPIVIPKVLLCPRQMETLQQPRKMPLSPSLVLYLPPHVLWLPSNFYILSSWRSGVFSSCCLALDSSSSFSCPAFRAIAKSVFELKNSIPRVKMFGCAFKEQQAV
ncbi:hypothetical protein STEG23_020250 [Scotinomys teguina]